MDDRLIPVEDLPPADYPVVQVDYLESLDMLQMRVGDTSGEYETIGQGLYIFRDKEGKITGFSLLDASRHLASSLDAMRRREAMSWDDAAKAQETNP